MKEIQEILYKRGLKAETKVTLIKEVLQKQEDYDNDPVNKPLESLWRSRRAEEVKYTRHDHVG